MSPAEKASYLDWNDSLAARFFRPEASGQPVYLYVSEDVVDAVGRSLGGRVEDFVTAVRAGPPWVTRTGLCQRALQAAEGWRSKALSYPPYIGYLALFVLAAGRAGDFAPHAYYPRLRELLGEPGAGRPPSFERMFELWDDLERWSVHDRRGDLGIFEARIVGGWIHVGLPLAQTVLTEEERRSLPAIFAAAGLDPTSSPSSGQLIRVLTSHGRPWLRPRTLAALGGGRQADSFIDALVDTVADDLASWDGETEVGTGEAGIEREVQAVLRLCLTVDAVGGRARATLRCRTRKEFPDAGLRLAVPGQGPSLSCTEFIPGWSSPVTEVETSAAFSPPAAAWRSGLVLRDSGLRWKLRLGGAPVRAFVDGKAQALPGLVEVLELPRRQPFYLTFHESAWPALRPWAEADCDGWRMLLISVGLPAGWILASADEAHSDDGVRQLNPALGFADRLSLRLVGGVRSSAGNNFFSFAPPRLAVEGAAGDESVRCADVVLEEDFPGGSLYTLPADLPPDTRIGIEVARGDTAMKRASLYLTSGFDWRLAEPLVAFDGCGFPLQDGTTASLAISGALVARTAPLPRALRPDPLRTPGLDRQTRRVFFIGRIAGAITCWPAEPAPPWPPIWAVPIGRRGRALYCGGPLEDGGPERVEGPQDPDRVKLWRQVLWHWRKRIAPPAQPALGALWRRYQEAARGR